MRPSASGLLKRMAFRSLDQVATVYGRDGTTGKYTDQLRTGLVCLLQPVNRQAAATGPDRVALAKEADFFWDPAYDLAENTQIEVDVFAGTRWNVRGGTLWAEMAPGNVIVYRRCDVVKAS